MYTLYYYYTETTSSNVKEREYESGKFRLRRDALKFVLQNVKNIYKKIGYTTTPIVGGLYCFKHERTEEGEYKLIELRIKVLKEW